MLLQIPRVANGNSPLDLSDPLNRGLYFCAKYGANGPRQISDFRNLVGKKEYPTVTGTDLKKSRGGFLNTGVSNNGTGTSHLTYPASMNNFTNRWSGTIIFTPLNFGSFQRLIAENNNGGVFPFLVQIPATAKLVLFSSYGLSGGLTGTTTLVAGTTYHLGFSLGAAGSKLYVNGKADGSGAFSGGSMTNSIPMTVGADNSIGYLRGCIEEIRLYNRELAAGEFQQLYGAALLGYKKQTNWLDRPFVLSGVSVVQAPISGTAGMSLSASANIVGIGVIAGSGQISLAGTGAIGGTGVISGSSQITLAGSAILTGVGVMSGSSSVSLSGSGDIFGVGVIAGSTTITLSAAGELGSPSFIVGSAAMTLAGSGSITGVGVMSGAASITLTTSASIIGIGVITGGTSLEFNAQAVISGVVDISGSAAMTISGSAVGTAVGVITAAGTLSFSSSANVTGIGVITGSSGMTLTAAADVAGVVNLTGSAAISLAIEGDIFGVGVIAGESSLTLAATGEIAGVLYAEGSASLSLNASGNAVGLFSGAFHLCAEGVNMLPPFLIIGSLGAEYRVHSEGTGAQFTIVWGE